MGSSRLAVVRVEAAEAELAADALWCRGATAIEERNGPAGAVELVAEVAALDSLDDLPWPVEVIEVDDSWWDGWRPFARAVRAGAHLVVQPPWAPRLTARHGDVVLLIDPGRAFGSGSHPSTLLALAALEPLVGPGSTVLDVGCGSGVLAVAAARLGAGRVVAIDIDPAAHAATLDNAARNGVAGRGAEGAAQRGARPLRRRPGQHAGADPGRAGGAAGGAGGGAGRAGGLRSAPPADRTGVRCLGAAGGGRGDRARWLGRRDAVSG